MKKLTIRLALTIFAFAVPLSAFSAIVSSNLLTYAATGGASTNYGTPVLIGQAYIQNPPTFLISDNGVVNTNALVVYVQYGLSTASNQMTTVATYTKPTTNAADGTVIPSGITINIYGQTQVITTNNVTVGSKAIFNR